MNNKLLTTVIDIYSNQQGIDRKKIINIIENSLSQATCKYMKSDIDIKVIFNHENGTWKTYQRWKIIKKCDFNENFSDREIFLEEAKKINSKYSVGDFIEKEIKSIEPKRIVAYNFKQIILQKIKKVKKLLAVKSYSKKIGQILIGTVKSNTKDGLIIDIEDDVEALLKKSNMIPKENFRAGDRIKAYFYKVDCTDERSILFLSRTHIGMLEKLLEIEIPEINEKTIKIISISRDPGKRSKIAVKTNDGRIDPIGACVGMRGSRVQAISNELSGERIDIILWDKDPIQFVINSLAPAEVKSIVLDENKKLMDVAIKKDNFSQAIGRSGQNVKLTSDLTKWSINILTEEEASEKNKKETEKIVNHFIDSISVEKKLAETLVKEGYLSINDISSASEEDLESINGINLEIAKILKEKSQNFLIEKAILDSNNEDEIEDLKDNSFNKLMEINNLITLDLAKIFLKNNIKNKEDLAEKSVFDLLEITNLLNEKDAGKIIMSARKHWFN